MIFVTGDTHGDFRRFNVDNFPEQREMTADDFMIICGDFGGIWEPEESKNEKYWLKWLNEKNYTTLFVDGNHENFTALEKYPVVDFQGGKAHKIRDRVYHMMRGEMFELQGLRFFCFGGASSHDISDGLLDPETDWKKQAKRLDSLGKYCYRVRNIDWWSRELPSEAEIKHAREVLEANHYECDFFISHCCALSTAALLGKSDRDILTEFFEEIKYKLHYKKHIFGHHHGNRNLPDNEILIYEQIIQIA